MRERNRRGSITDVTADYRSLTYAGGIGNESWSIAAGETPHMISALAHPVDHQPLSRRQDRPRQCAGSRRGKR